MFPLTKIDSLDEFTDRAHAFKYLLSKGETELVMKFMAKEKGPTLALSDILLVAKDKNNQQLFTAAIQAFLKSKDCQWDIGEGKADDGYFYDSDGYGYRTHRSCLIKVSRSSGIYDKYKKDWVKNNNWEEMSFYLFKDLVWRKKLKYANQLYEQIDKLVGQPLAGIMKASLDEQKLIITDS